MLRTLSFVLIFSLSLLAHTAEICQKFTTSLQALNEIPKKKCTETRDSKQCQELYQKNSTSMLPQEADRRKLNCDENMWSVFIDGAIPLPMRGACQAGVANFALDLVTSAKNVVVAIGTGIGESIAYLQIETEKAHERMKKCNVDPEEKKALLTVTISRWPKLMRPTSIPADLLKKDCFFVELWLRETERRNKNKLLQQLTPKMYGVSKTLTEDEQEAANYLDPNLNRKIQAEQSQTIADMAASFMNQLKDKAICYNSDFQTEIYCESLATAATFVIPGIATLRAARLEKLAALAGRKLTDVEIATLSEEALKAAKIKDLSGRQGLVDKVAALGEQDRLALAKQLLGRTLTAEEQQAILKAHSLSSTEDLLEKARILKKLELTAEQRELFMRTSLTGQPMTPAQIKSQLELVKSLPDSPNKLRLLAEAEGNVAKPDIEKMTTQFQKATEGYAKNIGELNKASSNDLSSLEYAASRWGSKATTPADVARAETLLGNAAKTRLDKEILSAAARASSRGAQFDKGAYVSEYINMLRSSPGSGLAKEATEFKIKAIIKAYNSAGWNLR